MSRYSVFCNSLTYFPGTDLYDTAIREGWIRDHEKDIYLKGIGVADNIFNRLLFLIAILKERGVKMSDSVIDHIIDVYKKDPVFAEELIDFIIGTVNSVEEHHSLNTKHLTAHPYLKGFNKWQKTVGHKGKKVLFRSYHEAYG
jgi:hypothetical protein